MDHEGNIDLLGDIDSQRAHVAMRNHELVSICLLGTFTDAPPPMLQQHGLRDAIAWLRSLYGDIPVKGHREFLQTACPGDQLFAILDDFR